MPVYDFLCDTCGAFPVMSGIAGRDLARACPVCGQPMTRAISAPALSLMSGGRRAAFATNERAAHAPRQSGEASALRHRPGCACCTGGKVSLARDSAGSGTTGGLKSAVGRRPWMISH